MPSLVLRTAVLCVLAACSGAIDDAPRPDSGVYRPDGSSGCSDCDSGLGECGETGQIIIFLEERCANGACHGAGGQFPELTRGALGDLSSLNSEHFPELRLLVPGDPEASFLYRKMAGTQGEDGGALMPLGTSSPAAETELIAAWIREGAPTSCDALPPPRVPYDPNTLDPEELFACADPSAPRSSPGRLRRIERQEFTHAGIRSLNGTWWGSTLRDNPLSIPDGHAYSSYPEGLSLDAATLDLYFLYLDEAAVTWSRRDPVSLSPPGVRLEGIYRDRDLWCVETDADPSDDCRNTFVDTLLRRGILFRAPSEREQSALRTLLDEVIAAEASPDDRQQSLHHLAQGAFLMSGALFRSELGQRPDAPSPMSDDDLALALGHLLSTHPVGAPFALGSISAADPDSGDDVLGRMTAIRRAADDGSIQDPDVRRTLLRRYASGTSPERPDIRQDSDDRRIVNRGAYWLAPGIARFFREWLDYESANSVFKDTPGATGQWPLMGNPLYDRTNTGYANLRTPVFYGHESSMVQQLDDTIARVIVETDAGSGDAFEELMTTRLWHLPSNRVQTDNTPCTSNDDCSGTYARCTPTGFCGNSISNATTAATRVYNITGSIEDTPEARWVTMPESERLGVLTHPAWLAAHGGNFEDDASLVHRGKWIREHLFCQTVPPLELVMVEAQLVPSEPEVSARQRVHRSIESGPGSETCMGCHRLMNSLGVTFETFNHAGFVRVEDHGAAPDGSTEITNAPDPALNRRYETPQALITALSRSAYARRSFVRHAFRFFMGRDEVLADGCTLLEMETALSDSGSFIAMLEALVASQTFSHRHTPESSR